MSNQPYEPPYEPSYDSPYEGYDPYQQPQQPQQPAPQPEWQQHTQQWEGQTWETQTHAPVTAADTAYLPPQGYGTVGQPLPPETPGYGWTPAPEPSAHEAPGAAAGGWERARRCGFRCAQPFRPERNACPQRKRRP